MKKSNVVVFALLLVASAFFLWLWYYLGLNHVDEPLDLVLSIVWWVVVAVAIGIVIKTEQVRRQRIRTVYVGDYATFNSEKGLMRFEHVKPMQDIVASILENLKYDFTREDFPESDQFDVKYFIRTKEFDVEKKDDQQNQSVEEAAGEAASEVANAATGAAANEAVGATTPIEVAETPEPTKWKGEVVVVETKEERAFETPEELATILATLERAAA